MNPLTIVKIGGGLVESLHGFWPELQRLAANRRVVLVHGGGPQATAMARRLGHEPTMVHGRRVTGDLDLDIVKWTMRGAINTALVSRASAHGLRAVGLSGVDGGLLRVHRRPTWMVDGAPVDFGWVGDVEQVHPEVLSVMLDAGFLPVVAPLGVDATGQVYNVNADTVASAIAQTMRAHEFLMVAESAALRDGPGPEAQRMERCGRAEFEAGVDAGWIQAGMRVKIQLGLEAAEAGIERVWILGPTDIVARQHGTLITA